MSAKHEENKARTLGCFVYSRLDRPFRHKPMAVSGVFIFLIIFSYNSKLDLCLVVITWLMKKRELNHTLAVFSVFPAHTWYGPKAQVLSG